MSASMRKRATSRNESCRETWHEAHGTRGTYEDRLRRAQQRRRLRIIGSRKAIRRMPDAPWTKITITNLCVGDRLHCPYAVAAGISCWARSDSIPHTCAAWDPTSSDSLTSQFHLSNTYYKGRTTRWRLSRFVPTNWQPCFLGGLETLGRVLFSLFAFLVARSICEPVQSALVRHQRRGKRKTNI